MRATILLSLLRHVKLSWVFGILLVLSISSPLPISAGRTDQTPIHSDVAKSSTSSYISAPQEPPQLPNFKLPYKGSLAWTGGPHGYNEGGNLTGKYKSGFGTGLDFGNGSNFEVLAMASGTVIAAECWQGNPSLGCHVAVKHDVGGTVMIYSHLQQGTIQEFKITKSMWVPQGQVLGKAGNTGTGPVHLHIEFRRGNTSCTWECLPGNLGGDPLGWDDLIPLVDGYYIGGYWVDGEGLESYNYEGSAVRGNIVGYQNFPFRDSDGVSAGQRKFAYVRVSSDFSCSSSEDTCELNNRTINTQFAGNVLLHSHAPDTGTQAGTLISSNSPIYPPSQPTATPRPPDPPSDGIELVSVSSHNVRPGQYFDPSVTIRVLSGRVVGNRDLLRATPQEPGNLFGAYVHMDVKRDVTTGQTYTFNTSTNPEFRMRAPDSPGSYRSVWQMSVDGRLVGPQVIIQINVERDPPPPSGWHVEYYSDRDLRGRCHDSYEDTTYIFKKWDQGSPASGCPTDDFSARYSRRIYFPGGDYRFHCHKDDACRIYIDNQLRLDQWWDSSYEGGDWGGNISAGDHDIRIEYYEKTGHAQLEAWWQGPGYLPRDQNCDINQAWCIDYYGNRHVMGTSAIRETDGTFFINRTWNYDGPWPGMPVDNFSVRFQRNLPLSCGKYEFHVRSDDGSRLTVNNQRILDRWDSTVDQTMQIDLPSANIPVSLEYGESGGFASVYMDWHKIGSCDSVPPSVTWTRPVGDGGTLSVSEGTLQLAVNATDASGIREVNFNRWDAVNHVIVPIAVDTTAPHGTSINVSALNIGANQINADATDNEGNWSRSYIWINRTNVPVVPTNLRVTSTTQNSVSLVWADVSSNESGFKIYRWNGSGWPLVGTTVANAQSYTDAALQCAVGYSYYITAFNNNGESPGAPYVSGTTLACPTATSTRTRIPTATNTAGPSPTAVAACGGNWKAVDSPNVGSSNNNLSAVKVISANNVWAVGTSRDGTGPLRTLIVHWDGANWSVVPSPNVGNTSNYLESIDAVSPNDIWAVGYYYNGSKYQTLTMHWNGSVWSVVSSPNTGTQHSGLSGVVAVSASDVWAVGYSGSFATGSTSSTFIMHWNGSDWSIVASPNTGNPQQYLLAIDAVSTNDIWAVGYSTNANNRYSTLVMHWNGAVWSIVPSPNYLDGLGYTTGALDDITVLSANNIWAVGSHGYGHGTITLRWNGSAWSMIDSPDLFSRAQFAAVAAIAPDDIHAVGYGFNSGTTVRPLIERWDGSAWSVSANYRTEVGELDLYGADADQTGAAWAVGYRNTGSADRTLIMRYYGSACAGPSNTPTYTATPTAAAVSSAIPTAAGTAEAGCTIQFEDVAADTPFYPYVRCLACLSILGGYSDNTFRPNSNVTRGQLSKIVSNAAGFSEEVAGQMFEDSPLTDGFYLYAGRLAGRGYISGYPCGGPAEPCGAGNLPYFRPMANATRGQISKIVSNAAGFDDTPSEQTFEDVTSNSPFYDWVQRLTSRNIMGGYPCGDADEPCGVGNLPYFRPNSNATRGQTAKIVSNTFFPDCQISARK